MMSFLNTNLSVKLINVQMMSWERSYVEVAPRPYHALVFRGRGEAFFSHGGDEIASRAETVTYMPANYSYHADYPQKNEIFAIHFDTDTDAEMENYQLCSPQIVSGLFQKAYRIWREGGQAYYFRTVSVFYEILEHLSLQTDVFFSSGRYSGFFKAVEYLKTNFTRGDLSIAALADIANMSDTYFRKLFFDRFHEAPSVYLLNLRLSYAEKLLSTGRYSVVETAFMSGFNDAKYFSRVVKQRYGYPPSKLFVHHARAKEILE